MTVQTSSLPIAIFWLSAVAWLSTAAALAKSTTSTGTTITNSVNFPSLLDFSHDKYESVLLDMDGVIWRGADSIDGSIEALNTLSDVGKRLLFVTNNSGKTRQQYVDKLKSKGFNRVCIDDIVTSGSVTAEYVKNALASSGRPSSGMKVGMKGSAGRVFMIGSAAFEQELHLHGIEVVKISNDDPAFLDEKSFAEMDLDDDIHAVVVGWDQRFTYRKLCIASLYLQRGDCHFIVTNHDAADRVGTTTDPSEKGDNNNSSSSSSSSSRDKSSIGTTSSSAAAMRLIPGVGPLYKAIEVASGRRPVICGKPSHIVVDHVMEKLNKDKQQQGTGSRTSDNPLPVRSDNPLPASVPSATAVSSGGIISRCLMVGDRLDTDIAFANSAGVDSCLVLTGCSSKEDVAHILRGRPSHSNSDSSISDNDKNSEKEGEGDVLKIPTYIADDLASLAAAFAGKETSAQK